FDFSWGKPVGQDALAAIESACNGTISKGLEVKTYVAPLDDAKQISSLRAVFGEKYPDPVRVVSICNTPIEEILTKPKEEIWKDYSIEFCGGTHLSNTREADALVILSEEGIAKGIRRITAVSQDRAKEARNTARSFAARVREAEALEGGELEAETKKVKTELEGLQISCVAKADIAVVIDGMTKRVKEYRAKLMSSKVLGAQGACAAEVSSALSLGSPKCCVRYDFGVDGKTAQKILKAVAKDVAVMILTADREGDKYGAFAAAPKKSDVDCKKWMEDTFKDIGGKGGGKKLNATRMIEGVDTIEKALEEARK
ncbi:hypothetical protein TrRE_jg13120, partial [Triparma retinervis]